MDTSIRVLLVDDDQNDANLTATAVEREDSRIQVETVQGTQAGLERLANDSFDCIVADYDMGEENGIAFLKRVRESQPHLPFILYTGKGSEEIASEAISAGVADYLQKGGGPSQYPVLANRIINAVEQERARQELAASQERLSMFFEQSPLGVIEWDETFSVVRMNEAAEEILGYDEAELRGSSWEQIVPSSDREAVEEVVSELLEAQGGYQSRNENVRADGTHIICEWHNRVVTDENDEVLSVFSQFQDVTEKQRFASVVTNLHDVASRLAGCAEREAIYEETIAAAEALLDFDQAAIAIEDDGMLAISATSEGLQIDPSTRLPVDEGLAGKTYRTGESLLIEDITSEPEATPQMDDIGAAISVPIEEHGVFQVIDDEVAAFGPEDLELTELLVRHTANALDRLENRGELERQNERLDEFVKLVSHDLRTPLTVAQGRIDLARQTDDQAHLDETARALERMETLIDDLLTYARMGDSVEETEPVDLATMAEQCWHQPVEADASLQNHVDLVIKANHSRFQQLLENLFRNAIEHAGENVSVVLGELEDEDGFYVADDGPGLDPDEADLVFESGYTTREDGSGFGLAIVREIVETHDWEIRVNRAKAGGARFEISGVETVQP